MQQFVDLVKLGSECTIAQAEAIHGDFLERIAACSSKLLFVDMSSVEAADVTLAQLLVSLRRSASANGVVLRADTSPAVDGLLARTGLAGWPEISPA